jgi:hypothetical protein
VFILKMRWVGMANHPHVIMQARRCTLVKVGLLAYEIRLVPAENLKSGPSYLWGGEPVGLPVPLGPPTILPERTTQTPYLRMLHFTRLQIATSILVSFMILGKNARWNIFRELVTAFVFLAGPNLIGTEGCTSVCPPPTHPQPSRPRLVCFNSLIAERHYMAR